MVFALAEHMRPDLCQASTFWKQFTYDGTWDTGEGRAKLVQVKLVESCMNSNTTLKRVEDQP